MINTKDVIRMKIPYPSVSGNLALSSHMYICQSANTPVYTFIKCQTLKPYMLSQNIFHHYCDEIPDITRNPFNRPTRIDCDKLFITKTSHYDDRLKTTSRPDVCQDLFDTVMTELNADGYTTVPINETELTAINPLIN